MGDYISIKIKPTEDKRSLSASKRISIVDKGRDRIRTNCGHLISIASIIISLTLGIMIFYKGYNEFFNTKLLLLFLPLIMFLVSITIALWSVLLKERYELDNELNYLIAIMDIYEKELRQFKYSFIIFIIGLATLITVTFIILI